MTGILVDRVWVRGSCMLPVRGGEEFVEPHRVRIQIGPSDWVWVIGRVCYWRREYVERVSVELRQILIVMVINMIHAISDSLTHAPRPAALFTHHAPPAQSARKIQNPTLFYVTYHENPSSADFHDRIHIKMWSNHLARTQSAMENCRSQNRILARYYRDLPFHVSRIPWIFCWCDKSSVLNSRARPVQTRLLSSCFPCFLSGRYASRWSLRDCHVDWVADNGEAIERAARTWYRENGKQLG